MEATGWNKAGTGVEEEGVCSNLTRLAGGTGEGLESDSESESRMRISVC